MRKDLITVEINETEEMNMLEFYLHHEGEIYLLTKTKMTGGVYKYFKNGVELNQLNNYRGKIHNPRLEKTIEERLKKNLKKVSRDNNFTLNY